MSIAVILSYDSAVGTLYVTTTPIGNLEDITLRALRILKEVDLIAAEDTRTTKHLLEHYGIKTRLTSYHEHNKGQKLPHLLELLDERDIALVSDAGTPGMSDPGYKLIAAAIEQGITVVPLPGAAAPVTALMASGLPLNMALFLGFLPRKKSDRRKMLQMVSQGTATIVTFEAPHRLHQALQDIIDILGNRRLAVCREMTKLHEEFFRGTAEEALNYFAENKPRGEFTLVIEGNIAIPNPELTPEIEYVLLRLKQRGVSAKEATKMMSDSTGIPKRELYQRWLKL